MLAGANGLGVRLRACERLDDWLFRPGFGHGGVARALRRPRLGRRAVRTVAVFLVPIALRSP